MSDSDESLTKVLIDLPNHWATRSESLWALPLGNDLFEIRNSPFYAYGINWGDVVRATSDDPSLKPVVREIAIPSGNRTLRVYFNRSVDQDEQDAVLSRLEHLDLSWERADSFLVAIDIHPNADYQAVCDQLWELEQSGTLEYETCEPRVVGSFDDAPEISQ